MARLIPILTLTVLLLIPGTVYAQDGDGGGDDGPAPGAEPDRGGDDRGGRDRGRGRDRGGRGGFGGRRGGGFDYDELGVSEEQKAQIEALQEAQRDEMREMFERMREEGGGRDGMREAMTQAREQSQAAIRELLTDEQRTKYDAMIEERNNRQQQGRGGRGRTRDPAEAARRRLEGIKGSLGLDAEEAEVILPLVEKVLLAQAAAREATRKAREELQGYLRSDDANADPAATEARVTDLRNIRDAANATVREAQGELRELLTMLQEAKLIAEGVLE